MGFTREQQNDILDSIDWTSPIAKGILARAEAGTITGDAAIAEYADLAAAQRIVTSPMPERVSMRHVDSFTQLKRDWVDSRLVLAGVMKEPDRDLNEAYSMSMSRFGRRCIAERDAGLVARAAKAGTGLEDLLFSGVRDWAETGASQTTADFPLAVEDIFSKSASLGYSNAIEPLTFLYNNRPVPNYLTHGLVQSVDVPPLVAVTENNAFSVADVGDYGEEAALGTKGIIYSVTRQTIVNNDTDSIALNASKAGKSGKQAEATDIAAVLNASYLLKDGTELFDATRGNITAVGSAPDVAGVDAIRAAMAALTGPSGSTLNLSPAVMITGRDFEGTAATLRNAQFMPMQAALTPGYEPGSFAVVSDGRLADGNWWMICDPRLFSFLEKLYLAGSTGEPVIEFFTQFEYDGVQARVRHDYKIAAADWRTAYKVVA